MKTKRLTILLSEECSRVVEKYAKSQKATYKSLVESCVALACASGSPIILEPFGEEEKK